MYVCVCGHVYFVSFYTLTKGWETAEAQPISPPVPGKELQTVGNQL